MASGSGKLLITATAGWNVLINRVFPEKSYVSANLAAAAAATTMSLIRGKSAEQLGLARSRLGSGLGWGAMGVAVVAGATVAGTRWRLTAPLFEDQRVNPDDVAYQTLIRIPLGTVLLEEVLFRGVLPAHLEPNASHDVTSSVLFGLWHVLPTLTTLDINSVERPALRVGSVAVAVTTTTAVGLGFGWLRRRTGSLLAPALIHWAANAGGYVAAARMRR
jgi:membrane protease YdiL (CAAX protease family)